MENQNNCTFCSIIENNLKEEILFKNDDVAVLLDAFIQPSTGGHVLVIPRKHYKNIFTLPESLAAPLMKTTRKLSVILKKIFPQADIRIWIANGRIAGQTINHLHIHVFPCVTLIDRIKYAFPYIWVRKYTTEERLKMAEPIRKELIYN